jgi:hypothetical protein
MAFVNRIRLPFKITRPQYTEEREVFRKSNGVTMVLSSVIRKRYEGETDFWPDKIHGRFKIALSHDNVTIEGEKYVGGVVQDGDYTINWPDFLDYPLGKAEFFVFATPFDATNSNCGACEEFSQIVVEDDNIGDVEESENLIIDVLANDSICCSPVIISIVTANSEYVESISITEDNEIQILIKDEVITQNSVILATYRAQCENGIYDEGNIIANVTGSGDAGCLAPLNVNADSVSDDTASITWTAPDPAPACGYIWNLYLTTDLGTPIQSGTTTETELDLTGLTQRRQYRIDIQSDCCDGNVSSVAFDTFTTLPSGGLESCGSYRLCYEQALPPEDEGVARVEYLNCNGDYEVLVIPNHQCREVCMLQSGPGIPVYVNPGDYVVTPQYLGLC